MTSEELSAAQKWNVMGIVELLKKNKMYVNFFKYSVLWCQITPSLSALVAIVL